MIFILKILIFRKMLEHSPRWLTSSLREGRRCTGVDFLGQYKFFWKPANNYVSLRWSHVSLRWSYVSCSGVMWMILAILTIPGWRLWPSISTTQVARRCATKNLDNSFFLYFCKLSGWPAASASWGWCRSNPVDASWCKGGCRHTDEIQFQRCSQFSIVII